jgi:hypothetical protein
MCVAVGLLVAGVSAQSQDGAQRIHAVDGGNVPTSSPAESGVSVVEPAASAEESRAAAAAADGPRLAARQIVDFQNGVMPDLRGADMNQLGDGGGVLYPLQGRLGIQVTKSIATDHTPAGRVVDQSPPPGTPLSANTPFVLVVSDGGPVLRARQLPADVDRFARTLPGFDPDEPLGYRDTPTGRAYKSDLWLFALDCEAVTRAYRQFVDGHYRTACPGAVEG